ncbi:putative phenylacetaldoxime dehydratase [Pseudomonas syringae pv. tomato]|nr:putative phenylacetaldoxime dehydratase [Pseudomonas syringae pv. tomato]RMQ80610.1 putative phenylacetaldoxime dehydratase [Pseudomonas syringae pv. tomato]
MAQALLQTLARDLHHGLPECTVEVQPVGATSVIDSKVADLQYCLAPLLGNLRPAFKRQTHQYKFIPLAGQVVMAYFGIQALHPVGLPDLAPITKYFVAGSGPQYWDSARCVDANGLHTCIAIAYWRDVDAFYQWRNDSGFNQWWQDPAREKGPIGWFLEVVCPSAERFETLFSAPGTPEGVAHLATHMSEPILEHAYWGSSRDRIPLAQTDALIGSGGPTSEAPQRPGRVRVSGRDNLCLIRSGQDWSSTTGQERDLYLNDIQPVLKTGMTFLRDEGATVGCLNCRFMQALDSETGEPVEKSFGLAWFDDLANRLYGHLKDDGEANSLGQTTGTGDLILGAPVKWTLSTAHKDVFSLAPYLYAPTGSYDNDDALNLGENRWRLLLQAAYIHHFNEKWALDTAADILWFSHNNDYSPGSATLEQKTRYEHQAYLRDNLSAQNHFAFGGGYINGGENRVGGINQDDKLSTTYVRISAAHMLTPSIQVQAVIGRDVEVEQGFMEKSRLNLRLAKLF